MAKSINEIANLVKTIKGQTRTLSRYSDAIVAHMEQSKDDKSAKRNTKSLGQVFSAATSGRERVTPGAIKTLANNALQSLQNYREDIAIDRGTMAKVKSDSALIRNGGAVVTSGVVDALEAAAKRFIAAYEGFKSDVVVNDDKSLTLDVPSEMPEVVA